MPSSLFSLTVITFVLLVASANANGETLFCPGGGEELDYAKINFSPGSNAMIGTLTLQFFGEKAAGKKFTRNGEPESSWKTLLSGEKGMSFILSDAGQGSNSAILRKSAFLHLEPKQPLQGEKLWGGMISADGTVYYIDDCSTNEKVVEIARANRKK